MLDSQPRCRLSPANVMTYSCTYTSFSLSAPGANEALSGYLDLLRSFQRKIIVPPASLALLSTVSYILETILSQP